MTKHQPGDVHGRWRLISHRGGYTWLARCSCGTEKPVSISNLTSGASKSCGCSLGEGPRKKWPNEIGSWKDMRARCSNPNHPEYKNYGGRGITVCQEWTESYADFIRDMGVKPTSKHSIERVNNSLGYCPDNCKWATSYEQVRNRRTNVILTAYGETKCLKDWARDPRCHVSVTGLRYRVRIKGMPIKEALCR